MSKGAYKRKDVKLKECNDCKGLFNDNLEKCPYCSKNRKSRGGK